MNKFNKSLRVVFFGTPDYVIPILRSLHKAYEVVAVVSQEPKAVGRSRFLNRSAVDNWAYKHKIPVYYKFEGLPTADLGICAAFGKIIPQPLIDHFRFGILNVHPSLLPKYRGASPVQAAISQGDFQTGVTVIKMDSQIDHGPIVSFFKEDILPDDTTDSLRRRLFLRSAQFLIDPHRADVGLIPNYLSGKITLKPQNEEKASYTRPATRNDGFIKPKDFAAALEGKGDLATTVERKYRALTPWPGIWTLIRTDRGTDTKAQTKRLKILKIRLDPNNSRLTPEFVQLEGKNKVSWKQFLEGYPNFSLS